MATSSPNCLLRNSACVLKAVNAFYVMAGGCVIGMGLYGLMGKANTWMPEQTGKATIAFGVVVVLTALMGFYGSSAPRSSARSSRASESEASGSEASESEASESSSSSARRGGAGGCRRCVLLLYFTLLALSLLGMTVMAIVVLADPDRIERAFQKRWNKIGAADKAAGQIEFACCGFDSTATAVVPATTPPTCAWNTAPANGLLAPCPPSAVRAGCQGCKEAAVAYLTRHFRAGFIACLATGVATVLGVWLSGYLLCRFDPAHKRHVEAMNRYDPAAAGIEMGAKKSKQAPAVWDFDAAPMQHGSSGAQAEA
jgi:hypothetical protein